MVDYCRQCSYKVHELVDSGNDSEEWNIVYECSNNCEGKYSLCKDHLGFNPKPVGPMSKMMNVSMTEQFELFPRIDETQMFHTLDSYLKKLFNLYSKKGDEFKLTKQDMKKLCELANLEDVEDSKDFWNKYLAVEKNIKVDQVLDDQVQADSVKVHEESEQDIQVQADSEQVANESEKAQDDSMKIPEESDSVKVPDESDQVQEESEKVPEKTSCAHVFNRGAKAGQQCHLKCFEKYCSKHKAMYASKEPAPEPKKEPEVKTEPEVTPEPEEPEEPVKKPSRVQCEHVYTRGAKKNTRCEVMCVGGSTRCARHKQTI